MKEAILLTDRPMDPKQCAAALAKTVPDVNGNDNVVSFGKPPKSLHIWFPSIAREDENEKFIYEDIPNLPVSLTFGTYVEYHRNSELKKAVAQLQEIHPELYVIGDNDTVFSAEEYLAQAQ